MLRNATVENNFKITKTKTKENYKNENFPLQRKKPVKEDFYIINFLYVLNKISNSLAILLFWNRNTF